MNADFSCARRDIGTWWYPEIRSSAQKTFPCPRVFSNESTRGNGYRSVMTVRLLRSR